MSVDGAQLWTLNQRLLGEVMDACTGELAEVGLETKEFFVLAEVEASPYPAEIATALLLPKASVTVYVRNLVAKGFIRREIDDADLRRHRLVLTAEGTAVRDRALAALAAEYDRRLARITPRDRTELRRILQEMLAPAGEPGAGSRAWGGVRAGTELGG